MSQKKTILARCDHCGQEGKFHFYNDDWFCECGAMFDPPLFWSGEAVCPSYGTRCKYCEKNCTEAGSEVIFSQ